MPHAAYNAKFESHTRAETLKISRVKRVHKKNFCFFPISSGQEKTF